MSGQASVTLSGVPTFREGLTSLPVSVEPVCQQKEVQHKEAYPSGRADGVCGTSEPLGQGLPCQNGLSAPAAAAWVLAVGSGGCPRGLQATGSPVEHLPRGPP